MWRLVAVWLSLAARSIAGVATSLPMAPTKPGLLMKPAVTRSSVKLQQGYGQQQGGYRQQGQHGFTVGSTPSGPVLGGREGSGGQVLWRLDRYCGVAGFSGVAGFTAEKKNYMYTPEDDDFFRPCALPYTLCSGDERPLSRWNMIEQKLTVTLTPTSPSHGPKTNPNPSGLRNPPASTRRPRPSPGPGHIPNPNPNPRHLPLCPHQVSRIQAIVKCSNDGAVLSSEGRGPTLWRMPGGQWNALYRGGTHLLNDGDQISLDCYDPEAAVFMCLREGGYAQQQQDQQYGYAQQQQGGYDQQQGGYQQQDQQSQRQLPYGWEQLMDQNSGHVYYSNSQTGQTQWEPPQ